jgi:secondary thiamine-phosphate synthase enzyme
VRVTVRQEELAIETRGRGLVDVTQKVAALVASSKVRVGVCNVFIRHTSASLVVQENADPAVLRDLQRWLDHVAPEQPAFGPWEHDDEGPDDMPAHVRSAITHTSESLPITDGKLALGTWQALYLWEHRTARHTRKLVVTILGE